MSKKPKIPKLNHIVSASDTNIYKHTTFLDYTFHSHRNRIKNPTLSARNNHQQKEYLFDLRNTLEINIEILKSTIDSLPYNKRNSPQLSIEKVMNTFNRKKSLIKAITAEKSKILIGNQIIEELKRKNAEDIENYNEKIREDEENMESKEEHFQVMQKKLKEVEIYVHRNANTRTILGRRYANWKMNEFLELNTNYHSNKLSLQKELEQIKKNITDLQNENRIYYAEIAKDDESNIKNSNDKQINDYISKYKKQIYIIETRMKLLRNAFKNMSTTLHLLTPITFHTNPPVNINDNKSQIDPDKSLLPLDITRRINNLMDFSIVLNRKDETKIELEKTGNFGNVSNINMWDISCINKK